MKGSSHPIVLYDGVCGLCHRTVRFLLRHDEAGRLRFAALQSSLGRRLLLQHRLSPDALDTLVLVEGARASTRSAAVLGAARYLAPPWRYLALFLAVPQPVRDRLYDWVARSRHRWFGRLDACPLPSPGDRERFLDDEP
ncbi:MAG: thiol-disulfide oxidoreductase DCC family protein [Vicinamibacteraceae bacterium]